MRVGHDDQLVAECRMQITATHQKTSPDTAAAGAADQRHRTRPFHSGPQPGHRLQSYRPEHTLEPGARFVQSGGGVLQLAGCQL
jgi:hypothetical protein